MSRIKTISAPIAVSQSPATYIAAAGAHTAAGVAASRVRSRPPVVALVILAVGVLGLGSASQWLQRRSSARPRRAHLRRLAFQ